MFFTSIEFIAFCAVLFILYYILPKKAQPWLLLLFSVAFFTSYSVKNLAYIAVTVLTTWGGALLMSHIFKAGDDYAAANKDTMTREDKKAHKAKVKRMARAVLIAVMLFNFGILAVLKYANFVMSNITALFRFETSGTDLFLSIALPLGISYYTFMCMGYMIDVYRGKYKADRNIMHVALFAAYFPQLVQGPFSRFDEMGETLFAPHKFDGDRFSSAALRIAWGYFKKLVLADRVAVAVNALIAAPDQYRGAYVVAAVILYSIRIYGDFTGGIDITIGISEALGIKLKENFVRPYFSKSIAEYWRRWHITLGEWFREYIFYPISISKPINKFAKKLKPRLGAGFAKRLPIYTATIITWFVTGIWHGATWNFIAWGMANCVVILISEELSPLYEKFHAKTGLGEDGVYGAFMSLRTYLLMGCIRMFDCYATVGITFAAIGSIFTVWNPGVLFDGSMLHLTLDTPGYVPLAAADYMILALGSALIFVVSVLGEKKTVTERLAPHPWLRLAATMALIFATLVFGAYGLGYNSTDFIYGVF